MNNDISDTSDLAASAPEPEPESVQPTTAASLATKCLPSDHISSLHSSLYQLILLNSSAIYYLDCFSLLLGLRYVCLVQASHGGGSGIRSLTICLLICVAVHTFHGLPEPSTYAPHFLYGGALVDFVGERPAGRTRLIVLDIWVFALQILYLTLGRKLSQSKRDGGEQANGSADSTESQAQDIDAEEAGVLRADQIRQQQQVETDEGIEMQSLLPENDGETRSGSDGKVKSDDSIVVLRRRDFVETLYDTGADSQTAEMNAATQRFWARVRLLQELQARRVVRATGTNAQAA